MSIRVATFNVENLFARYNFNKNFDPAVDGGFGINDLAFTLYNDDSKRLTAKAIREVNADIVCLQEVENIEVLERFNSWYLGGMKYYHRIVIDSHDPRHIDVAVLSRLPFTYINSHRHERNDANTTWKFSRDCLEVDVEVEGKELSLYVNHLKSMMYGRDETRERREEQAKRVAEIVDEWWEADAYKGNFIVVGDMNDYVDAKTSLKSLVNHPGLVNVVDRLPKKDQWTHYYAGEDAYRQLDYLLISEALAGKKKKAWPGIMRKGLPWRAEKYGGARFNGVGENHPKASDHCPLFMDLELV